MAIKQKLSEWDITKVILWTDSNVYSSEDEDISPQSEWPDTTTTLLTQNEHTGLKVHSVLHTYIHATESEAWQNYSRMWNTS